MKHGRAVALTLTAGLAAGAIAVPIADASTARILSLNVAPTKVHRNGTVTATIDLSKRATMTFQVARCLNAKCTSRVDVGKSFKRQGNADLNSLQLKLRVRPAKYALVVSAGHTTKKAVFRVVQ